MHVYSKRSRTVPLFKKRKKSSTCFIKKYYKKRVTREGHRCKWFTAVELIKVGNNDFLYIGYLRGAGMSNLTVICGDVVTRFD